MLVIDLNNTSLSEEIDMGITEILIILQDHVNIVSMITDYETKKMSASEEIKFLQFILDSGIVWAMHKTYIKRVEDYLEKGLIYFN